MRKVDLLQRSTGSHQSIHKVPHITLWFIEHSKYICIAVNISTTHIPLHTKRSLSLNIYSVTSTLYQTQSYFNV